MTFIHISTFEQNIWKSNHRIGDVANSKRPLLVIPKVQLRLRVTRRSATALARYPQKLAKIVCGGTTLNQLPIGLHVKILNFNGRFEAYWATFWMLSWYQSIQNRWKFNICFNVWVVVGILFAVRARKQRPPCFWPDFKPQNTIPPPSHHTGLLSSSKQYLIFLRF